VPDEQVHDLTDVGLRVKGAGHGAFLREVWRRGLSLVSGLRARGKGRDGLAFCMARDVWRGAGARREPVPASRTHVSHRLWT
jgi:hypothetical protein